MGRRLLLINAVMLVGIYLLGRHVTASWNDYHADKNIANVVKGVTVPDKEKITVTPPAAPEAPLPDTIFSVIPDKDLFSPERRPPPPPDQVPAVEPPAKLAKNPSLNGILRNQDKKQALITVFEGSNARGASRTVGVGDIVQGYTVSDIADTTLTLKWKDTPTEIVIDMFDATPQQESAVKAPQRIAGATIVTIGSSAPAVDAGADADSPGGAEAAVSAQPGAGPQPGAPRPLTGGRMQPGNTPRNGEGAVAPPANRPGVVGSPGSVPFTSRTRREN